MTKAVAYFRTSSTANVGEDKDSEARQRRAVETFAASHGFELVAEFYDAGISGTVDIQSRPAFSALLDRIEGNGVRVVICEDASRLSRKLLVQELGIAALIRLGVRLFAANGEELTATDDEMRIAMRQMAGAFSQLEKARLVKKLKSGREKKVKNYGWCWQKDLERVNRPACDRARALRAADASITLRAIASTLAADGLLNSRGQPFAAKVVRDMLRRGDRHA